MNSMVLNKQWSSRPDDQRFLTMSDLYERVVARKQSSNVIDVALDQMTLSPTDDGEMALADRNGSAGLLTHWAFSQLCARAKAPASYLRKLPATLAAIPLQWSMEHQEQDENEEGLDGKLLLRSNGSTNIAAITSSSYGRIWDADVVAAIMKHVDLEKWKVPAASYQAQDPKRATTLYASDRDIFIFLVCENTVEASGEILNRGFYTWNSEVGSEVWGLATFTHDRICDNRIIWGMKNCKQIRIRHTSGGPHRFANAALPQLAAYAESSAAEMEHAITRAKAYEIAKDKEGVKKWLKARGFSLPQSTRAYEAAEADPRGYNPRSLWGIVQGLTDDAHRIGYTDARVALEEKAGALMDVVSA